MGRRGSGVEVRASSIRIQFVFEGKTYRERLIVDGKALRPTPSNLKIASKISAEIKTRIERGTFNFIEFFPESTHSKSLPPNTFGEMCNLWLKSKGQLEDATKNQYTNAINLWKRVLGERTPMDKLTFQILSSKIGSYPWASPKSANNYLIPLRGVFSFEYHGRRASDNPIIGIKNFAVVKKLPDPLTTDERDRILADMENRYDVRIYAYFTFQFYTGLRPEETIALKWSDIDCASQSIRVQRVRTFRGSERDGTKTHAERDVDLVAKAVAALNLMKPYTLPKEKIDEQQSYIFENPVTGKPWHDERSQREHYWTPTLKRLGIRYRRAYNTRHTYATTALMAGVNPSYISRQLGHANTKMLFEKYARWIDGADKGVERKALEKAFGGNSSQNSSQEKGELY